MITFQHYYNYESHSTTFINSSAAKQIIRGSESNCAANFGGKVQLQCHLLCSNFSQQFPKWKDSYLNLNMRKEQVFTHDEHYPCPDRNKAVELQHCISDKNKCKAVQINHISRLKTLHLLSSNKSAHRYTLTCKCNIPIQTAQHWLLLLLSEWPHTLPWHQINKTKSQYHCVSISNNTFSYLHFKTNNTA